jgi:predicted 3-demethylubiquinone-9 3-methyltransferase (glyoxalase superfamily)
MQKITPFVWFDDQAEAAAKFYVSVFKKKSKIVSVSRYGDSGPGPKGGVMVVELQLAGQRFLFLNGGPHYKLSPAFSLFVTCKTQKEIDYYWNKLTSGGGAPSQCGWLTDKFGFSWQIVPELIAKVMAGKDTAKAARVMTAFMPMQKLELATLEAAAKAAPRAPRRKAA